MKETVTAWAKGHGCGRAHKEGKQTCSFFLVLPPSDPLASLLEMNRDPAGCDEMWLHCTRAASQAERRRVHLSLRNHILVTSTSRFKTFCFLGECFERHFNFSIFRLGMHSPVNHSSYHSPLSHLSLIPQITIPSATDSSKDAVEHAPNIIFPSGNKAKKHKNSSFIRRYNSKDAKFGWSNIFNHIHTQRKYHQH